MPQNYPSLAQLAQNDPAAYQAMPVTQRLGMVQQPYFSDKESMSPQDLQLMKLLSARNRREAQTAQGPAVPLAPEAEGPGMLGKLFQFFTGRQAVDPMEDLKRPGYAGRPSR